MTQRNETPSLRVHRCAQTFAEQPHALETQRELLAACTKFGTAILRRRFPSMTAEDIEDCVLHATHALMARLRAGERFQHPAAFCARALVNAAIDCHRAQREQPLDDDAHVERIVEPTDPEQRVVAADEFKRAPVDERTRLVLWLTFYDGLSRETVAALVGIRRDLVDQIITRARRRLGGTGDA